MRVRGGLAALGLLILSLIGACTGPTPAEVTVIGPIPDLAMQRGVRFAGLTDGATAPADLERQMVEQLRAAGYGPDPAANIRLLGEVIEQDGEDPVKHLVVRVSLELVQTDRLLGLAEVAGRRGVGQPPDAALLAVARGTIRVLQATGLQPLVSP